MASQNNPRHLLIIEDDQGRKQFLLDGSVYSIGRDTRCDIRLFSQFVSRRHATLVQLPKEDGSCYYRIVDGDSKGKPSANGMLINGRKILAHDLKNRDEIIFGPQVRAGGFGRLLSLAAGTPETTCAARYSAGVAP